MKFIRCLFGRWVILGGFRCSLTDKSYHGSGVLCDKKANEVPSCKRCSEMKQVRDV